MIPLLFLNHVTIQEKETAAMQRSWKWDQGCGGRWGFDELLYSMIDGDVGEKNQRRQKSKQTTPTAGLWLDWAGRRWFCFSRRFGAATL